MTDRPSNPTDGGFDRPPETPNPNDAPRHLLFRRSGSWSALWCLPYLLLGLVWVFTNPPGAAPDESDHLIKAIAAGRLEIGHPFEGSFGEDPIMVRNASIARTVWLPARLAPDGYSCSAFQPDTTADCLPDDQAGGPERVQRTTAVGAYPVMMYVPLGLAANMATNSTQAFHLARLTSLTMSVALLFLGVWHLARFLGPWAPIGLAAGITPVAVFAASSVSTSGVEIMSAAAVAAVALVGTRQPSTLANPGTLAILAISGSVLILSRQLGVVTFSVLAAIMLLRGGARVVLRELQRHNPQMLAATVVLGLSGLCVVWWELRYDHPAFTGTPLSAEAFSAWRSQTPWHVVSGVGRFGWLDTPLPQLAIGLWAVMVVVIFGTAILVGTRADALTLAGAAVVLLIVSYVTYSIVFFPISAGLQGRHLLPMFIVLPTLAGMVVAESQPRARARQTFLVAMTVAPTHALALFVNARRYSVGVSGPWWFLPVAKWSPIGGWGMWLALTVAAATLLAYVLIRNSRVPVR